MLIKNIVGAIIIILNMAGLGFLFYLEVVSRFHHADANNASDNDQESRTGTDKQPVLIDEDIIPDEDDLLKDMDLSDLDSLDLDEFD